MSDSLKLKPILERRRLTIMDGEVFMYAEDFIKYSSIGGKGYDTMGPFEVSASRNGIMVHHAYCQTEEHMVHDLRPNVDGLLLSDYNVEKVIPLSRIPDEES